MSKIMKMLSVALVLALSVGLLAGCSAKTEKVTTDDSNEATVESGAQGSLIVVGSTSVTPIAEELAAAFMEMNPQVTIDIQGIGSSAGVKATKDLTADIGMSSRNLKEEEKTWGLKEYTIAFDGIAVAIHPSNPVADLSKEQISDIFSGKIRNWSEVGGSDAEILVVSREAGSGTRGAFEELMDLVEKNDAGKKVSIVKLDALIAEGNGAVKANVASKENSIGYISLSYMDETVKSLSVDNIDVSVENIVNGSYKISRPFLMLSNGEENELQKLFIEYILSDEGQEVVAEKLIPVNK
ncbi:MAG: phosphate ABC transporter substrate-binding protein [Acidaminobacteraceae bacterium]